MGIVIIGFPRSGKTTLGKTLSSDMGLPFYDTDEMIKQLTGVTPRAYFLSVGEARFRMVESETLRSAPKDGIVATGGGIVLSEDSRAILKEHNRVVFLKISKDLLRERLEQNPLPSNYCDFERLYVERLPLYESLANEVWNG